MGSECHILLDSLRLSGAWWRWHTGTDWFFDFCTNPNPIVISWPYSQSIDPVTTRFHQGCCTIIARPSTTFRVSLNWMTFITYICTFPSPLCGFQRDFVCVILTNIQMSRVVSFGWFCTSELLRKPSYEINGFPPRRDNLSDICVDFEPCKSIGCKTS